MARKPLDQDLYDSVVAEAKRKFDVWPSAYASGWVVKTYKARGGRYAGGDKKTRTGLTKWFGESWVDLSRPIREDGEVVGYEPCGRKKSGDPADYPKCRPKREAMRMTPAEVRDAIKRKRAAEAKAAKGRGGRGARAPVRVATYKQNPQLTTVYHVGRLDQPRRMPAVSYEGSGLSVSLHPAEWRKIARGHVGGDTWELTKEDPKFLMATAANKKKAVDWAVANGWIAPQKRYRVSWFDDEMDDTMNIEFDSLEEAQEEADNYDVEPEEVDSFVLDKKGKAYWKQTFSSKPSNSFAKDFAIIWFAEANGYDGVWWNEKLDPARLSAPRGVIFQSKLPEWTKRKIDDARRNPAPGREPYSDVEALAELASGGYGSFDDYYERWDTEDLDPEGLRYGRKVIWQVTPGRAVKIDPDYVVSMPENIFDPDKLAAIVDAVESGDKPVFDVGYGTVRVIGERDVAESQEAFERGETLTQRPLDEGDIGKLLFTVRDGNHRVFGALIAGERHVWMHLSDNDVQDVREWRRDREAYLARYGKWAGAQDARMQLFSDLLDEGDS